jgi:putative inorganic carbon (HCO3(-)) transporter
MTAMASGWRSIWAGITLQTLPFLSWWQASSFYRLVGLLQDWRQGSWFMQWAEGLGFLFVALLYGLAPFVSTSLIGILLLACAAYWGVLTITDGAKSATTPVHVIVFLYWLVMVAATAFSPVRSEALHGLVTLTLYIVLFGLLARLLRSPRLRNWVVTVYLHAALVVSAVGIRQWFFGADALATWVDPESSLAGTTRVYSFLGNPNLLAAYLLPAVIFSAVAVLVWQGWVPKVLAGVMTLTNMACLVLTFSRGAWIGLVVSSGVLFLLLLLLVYGWRDRLPGFWRKWLLPMMGFAALGFIAFSILAVFTVEPLRDRALSIVAGREDSSNNFRINVWMAVIEMIRDRPILGIGPGHDAFNRIYPYYQQPGFTALSAYSIFLEAAVEAGLIGFSCFMWLLLVSFNQALLQFWRSCQQHRVEGFWLIAAIATMMGMLAHGMVDTVWYRPQVNTLWWLMLSVIASYYPGFAASSDENLRNR